MEGELPGGHQVQRRHAHGRAMGPEQAVGDSHAHVRRAHLGQHGIVGQFHQGMDHGLGMHQHADAFAGHAVEMEGLGHFQPFVHQGGGINADFRAHPPVGVLQGLLHRNLAQFRRAFAAKGAARSGEHQVGDLLAAPGQALKNGVVFRIHGQDDRAGAGADVAHQTTGQDQGFLVGQTDDLARQGRRQGSGQPGRAHLGRKHGGGFGQGRQLRIALAPYQNARPVSGGKQGGGAAKAAEESEKPEKRTAEKEETLDELMAQLDSLIGLETVKREVRSLINLIKVRAMRKEHDLKVMNMSFHMVFTGNPGTGKTTVARLVAKIYKQLGFLSKGQLIETDRSGLVAGYVGQTAGKVTDVVNSALGGILFIDEAYALARKGMENDFGHEAIDTLVKLMEDHRDDLVVIVAGYTDEMHDFLTSNPGLISRFNKYIDFPDYTDDELMAILEMNAGRQGYRVAEAAKAVVRGMLTQMTLSERMDFGNARGMRNTLEKLVQAQANRLAACEGEVTRDMLEEITEADAKAALVGEEEQKQADSENVAQLAERGEQE